MTSTVCGCGCGEMSPIAPRSRADRGHIRGLPMPKIPGHGLRGPRTPYKRKSIEQLFWVKVQKTSDCWLWIAGLDHYGYGSFAVDRVTKKAHRVAYEFVVGPIPDSLVLDHLCRNRACVNPEHLEPVTLRENKDRGLSSSTKTHCIRGHEFTTENTYIAPRTGLRNCRACRRRGARKAVA